MSIERKKNLFSLAIPYIWLLVAFTSIAIIRCSSEALQTEDYVHGNPLNQIVFGLLMLLGLPLLWSRRNEAIRLVLTNVPFILIITYAFISIFWSEYPMVGFRRYVFSMSTVEMALIVASGDNPYRDFFKILYAFLITISVLSLAVIILLPHVGVIAEPGGAWRGVGAHKNSLGRLATIGAFYIMYRLQTNVDRKTTFWDILLLGINLTFLIMSKSASAQLGFMAVMFLYAFFILFKLKRGIMFILVICSIVVLAGTVGIIHGMFLTKPLPEVLLDQLGKDATLTGRVYLWDFMIESIKQHPLWGCGFGSFWLGLKGHSKEVYNFMGYYPFHAHNGYLDILNELGIAGFTIFLIYFLYTLLRIVRMVKSNYNLGIFWMGVVLLAAISNIMDTSFMQTNHLYWFLFALASLLPVREVR